MHIQSHVTLWAFDKICCIQIRALSYRHRAWAMEINWSNEVMTGQPASGKLLKTQTSAVAHLRFASGVLRDKPALLFWTWTTRTHRFRVQAIVSPLVPK
jgi:hypothetical protein